jgi:hypothetical protein
MNVFDDTRWASRPADLSFDGPHFRGPDERREDRVDFGDRISAADGSHIAYLSDSDIRSLSNSALIELIGSVPLPCDQESLTKRLLFQERPTLERLAFLARRIGRYQVTQNDPLLAEKAWN